MHDLSTYIELIRSGDVVAFPTETVYGLGADAWNPSAISKVFETKGRPSDNPLIVHIAERKQVHDFAKEIPPTAQKLMDAFWPGPLTIVLKKKPKVLDLITAGLETVAIRMPDHPLALEFISGTGPLVAPSANTSGRPSPTKVEHVKADFGEAFPVIDGKATKVGLESTVLDLTSEKPEILRPGSISRKELQEVLRCQIHESFLHHLEAPKSPGQKYSHYKPKAKVRWLNTDEYPVKKNSLYLLIYSSLPPSRNIINYNGNIEQLARELYDRFRQADIQGYSTIVIEDFSNIDHSIVSALLNRVQKAVVIEN